MGNVIAILTGLVLFLLIWWFFTRKTRITNTEKGDLSSSPKPSPPTAPTTIKLSIEWLWWIKQLAILVVIIAGFACAYHYSPPIPIFHMEEYVTIRPGVKPFNLSTKKGWDDIPV